MMVERVKSPRDVCFAKILRPKRNDRHRLTRCLYVDSSIGIFSGHLKQHMHQTHTPGTYALRFHKDGKNARL